MASASGSVGENSRSTQRSRRRGAAVLLKMVVATPERHG